GWTGNGLGLMALIPTSGGYTPIRAWSGNGPAPDTGNAIGTQFGDYTGFSLSPVVTILDPNSTTAPNTVSLTAGILPTKIGFTGWISPEFNLEGGKLYRLR